MGASQQSEQRSMAELKMGDRSSLRFVSIKTLAQRWDCSRTTVSRPLDEAGVGAYYFGQGRNGSKRYRQADIDRYLQDFESA